MVGKNIRERRSQAEMTQQALADSTHMTRFMVSKLERGMRSPTIDQAIRIADALRCSVESLIYDDSLSPHD